MWFEVIRWGSIVLCWIALGLNIVGMYRNHKLSKLYRRCIEELREKIEWLRGRSE